MNISEIVSLFAGICVTMGFTGGVIFTLIRSKLKQDADKFYVSKEHLSNNYLMKDDLHVIFMSRGRFDLIIKPFEEKIDSIIAKLDHIERELSDNPRR